MEKWGLLDQYGLGANFTGDRYYMLYIIQNFVFSFLILRSFHSVWNQLIASTMPSWVKTSDTVRHTQRGLGGCGTRDGSEQSN